ncbi:MAG TPA: TonB-dependent receptor plug domain-containing protein [Bacteroidales bacterium]|nr:TonB-dependent receptor plug domain-containing protein [Bacteroidales bacterium]HOX73467.1 TonB-dependent receptor plug domain-containing protein [Bacteroidales bacterium]HPM86890.1 TonB-dependent receptor plug domain-containing protein [Bacteroidales bacterium]HQM68829.1 TonB-dependent receptor plug domain-containing protein [Bacteroidales bacterium]
MPYRILAIILASLMMWPVISAQKETKKFFVTGVVLDSEKNPVEGAIILIDNKYTNKSTDNKGSFRVKVGRDAELISVVTPDKGIGEALIDGEKILNITLRPGTAPSQSGTTATPREEEKVDIGYGSIRKKDLTTPVNQLDVRNSRYSTYTNIYEMLKGAVPGVQVSGTKITIQGAGSLMMSTDPLFIVDGNEVGSISDIPPSQVESVQVLKGASASIYGSRGANGVILIKLIGANTRR